MWRQYWKQVLGGPNSSTAFTNSLASEQSRDITFTALVPLFQIQNLTQTQTLTVTLTNPPNHAI